MASGGPSRDIKRESSFQDRSHTIQETWLELFRNFFIVFVIALIVWTVCAGMRWFIEFGVRHLLEPVSQGETFAPWLLIMVLCGGGIIRGVLLTLPSWKSAEGDGVATALHDFHQTYQETTPDAHYERTTLSAAMRRVCMTVLTIGTGGSGGLEAPVLPIGQEISSWLSKTFRVNSLEDLRAFQMAGLAAAVASLLDAPFTAALFAAELLFTDRLVYRMLIYSMFAAIVAFALNNNLALFEPLFELEDSGYRYSLVEYVQVAMVATVVSAPAGVGVQWVFQTLQRLVQPIPSILRPMIGALGTGLIGLFFWFYLDLEPRHVLGVGEETLKELLQQEGNPLLGVWWVLLILVLGKTLATGLTLMSGGSAGMLVPAMFIGGSREHPSITCLHHGESMPARIQASLLWRESPRAWWA